MSVPQSVLTLNSSVLRSVLWLVPQSALTSDSSVLR